mgnify:CR=1 FL=1
MAKNTGDLILRDRMQFDFSGAGQRTTLYGRMDLSAWIDPISRQGLAIKEILIQPRNSASAAMPLTGSFPLVGQFLANNDTTPVESSLKIYATTRAYENASDVGIASPDVLCVYLRQTLTGPHAVVPATGVTQTYLARDYWYGPNDLHPEGYTVVSDLLIGIAADNWVDDGGSTIELDIVIVAEPVKVTEKRMNEILSQAQDL